MGTIVLVCCRFTLAIDKNEEMFKIVNIRGRTFVHLKKLASDNDRNLGGEKEDGRNRTFEIR